MTWELRVAVPAERGLKRLSEKAAVAVVEFMTGPLVEEPRRLGKPLTRELEGFFSARRGQYRIVYYLNEGEHAVEVVRIDHRSRVYRKR